MRKALPILLAVMSLALVGCNDSSTSTTAPPADVTPPDAPRGLYSTTGDGQVLLRWLPNNERDLAGYRIYQSPCASGPDCPYDRVGSTAAAQFAVTGLNNGVTRFYAVAAVDQAGNESPLSFEDIFDTPRPAGSTVLGNFVNSPVGAGWDFSAFSSKSSDDPATDIFFGYNGAVYQMFTKDVLTDIQDAGYATSLDAVDYAPDGGWSPSGTAELIPGHCYLVWTRDDHYAKFRVTGLSPNVVSIDWAYQTDPGNPELHARRVRGETASSRPITWIRP
jgi:hypothetical protein